jgi:hypothetical protein
MSARSRAASGPLERGRLLDARLPGLQPVGAPGRNTLTCTSRRMRPSPTTMRSTPSSNVSFRAASTSRQLHLVESPHQHHGRRSELPAEPNGVLPGLRQGPGCIQRAAEADRRHRVGVAGGRGKRFLRNVSPFLEPYRWGDGPPMSSPHSRRAIRSRQCSQQHGGSADQLPCEPDCAMGEPNCRIPTSAPTACTGWTRLLCRAAGRILWKLRH